MNTVPETAPMAGGNTMSNTFSVDSKEGLKHLTVFLSNRDNTANTIKEKKA
jgi:hypothetical protein